MTDYSQNGYSCDPALIVTATVPGTAVALPVRKGPAGQLLIAAAARWHREVEPLVVPGCWGYAARTIRGSNTELSNHASGTAIDLNAPRHALGAKGTFTPSQVAAIHRLIADALGALRWGGDYTGRVDEMHLEVLLDEAHCAAALPYLTTPEDDMPWTHAEGAPSIPDFYPGAKQDLPDPATALAWSAANAANARDAAKAAGAKVDALRADLAAGRLTPALDYAELAKALLAQMPRS